MENSKAMVNTTFGKEEKAESKGATLADQKEFLNQIETLLAVKISDLGKKDIPMSMFWNLFDSLILNFR